MVVGAVACMVAVAAVVLLPDAMRTRLAAERHIIVLVVALALVTIARVA